MTAFFQSEHSYNSYFHYHCLKNCFYQLLQYYGVPNAYLYIDIAMHFSLTAATDLCKCAIDNDIASLDTISLLRPYEIRKQFDHRQMANEYLSKALEDETPVIVTVDTFYLPYQLAYHKYHGSHAIFICKEMEDAYLIVDWYEPHYYKGLLNKTDLELARGSQYQSEDNPFSHIYPHYQSWAFQPDIARALQDKEETPVFLQNMKNIYQNFYKPTFSLLHADKYFGILAFEKLIQMLQEQMDQIGFHHLFLRKLHNSIFLLYIQKRILYFYIQQYSQNHGNMYANICEEIGALLAKYQNVLFIIMKYSKAEKKENTGKIPMALQTILLDEKKLGEHINKMAEGE